MKALVNTHIALILFIASLHSFELRAQSGVYFDNDETGDYVSSMQNANFTYLLWDRNDDGDGHFLDSNSPNFFYWDNDISELHFLVDTENMKQLKAEFGTATIAGNVGIGTTNTSNGALTVQGVHGNLLRLEQETPGAESVIRMRSKKTDESYFHADISLYGDDEFLGLKVPYHNSVNEGYGFILNSSGNVGIGTTTPDAKLTVKGDIHAEEINVDLNVPGPDYVFEEDYDLLSLEETENFIKTHKHLPEIPSAKEMAEKGIDVAEMNMLLLKKVEELTLHVIDLKKENREHSISNTELRSELNELKERVNEMISETVNRNRHPELVEGSRE